MSRTYKRITTDLDPERGNAVTIRREDVAPLVKTLPPEVTAPIIDAFIRWFCNVAEPEIKDELARAVLEQFKERQREAVKRYVAVCDSRRPDTASEPDGETQVGTTIDKSLNKEKVKNEVNTSVLYCDASVTPQDGSSPAASPSAANHGTAVITKEDVVEAKQTIMTFAPAPHFVKSPDLDDIFIDKRTYDEYENLRQKFNEQRAEDNWSWVSQTTFKDWAKVEHWSNEIDSELKTAFGFSVFETDELCTAWEKYRDMSGTSFDNAVWTFHIDMIIDRIPPTDKDGNPTNPRKLLFGRLRRVAEAQTILSLYEETVKRK